MFEQRKLAKEIEAKFLALVEVEKTFTEQLKNLNKKYEEALEKLKGSETKLISFENLKREVLRLLDKSTRAQTDLDSTLSCLSCLEYLCNP
jgi:hypothetical protein